MFKAWDKDYFRGDFKSTFVERRSMLMVEVH